MSIDSQFTDTIQVQTGTVALGGATTYANRGALNKGYIRVLGSRERASVDKPTLFATHRAVMTRATVPAYGEFLLINGTRYKVKLVDQHSLSGGGFQTVDCEVVT